MIAYIPAMKVMTSSEFRKSLSSSLDQVRDDHEPLLVTRPGGNAVVVSEEHWSGMEETLFLMRSPRNAERLLRAIDELNEGKGVERELIRE